MRRTVLGLAACTLAAIVSLHSPTAEAATACDSARVTILKSTPVPALGWTENVAYDHDGSLWVTRTALSEVQRLDPRGRVTRSVTVPLPGGIAPGPDGDLYVTSFSQEITGVLSTGKIYRFDPDAAQPKPRIYTRGLGFPNGLAFDAQGNAYVGDTWQGVLKVLPDGQVDRRWSARAPRNLAPTATVNGSSMNGVAVDGDTLYVTMTTSLTGRVLKVPLAHPDRVAVGVDVTAPLPGIVDDLAVVAPGRLAVATTTGQLIIADTATRRSCVVQLGQPATSVAVNPTDTTEFALGTELGAVLRVTVK
ncbi:hypothetical protein GII30_21825 [Gordonia amarae]|uniref:SMP-30/Gluconolactonase/LRE-like region domain-containing protein n=2 Tax=Gordonia amarae TaxID=36821 RepID=G7GM53_9ACTN|nr:SMP-30/gluconolactonase/LRE family protein [Gordonia amarae]MCS3876391.1 sugar lactone lactonase YvrE [Gordonia amarae]QHN19311.1 hypothetical protein GII35_22120 [Gordonia amarae]QHN23787.1 hypothetical protein GII34_21620 [Gordonia amarae]QHN32699.1 hypothetical protein GII32_21950 [Gordonia amarae]QHN41447.1 hypothetical protein GII30_21825 [Gordonia amarae]